MEEERPSFAFKSEEFNSSAARRRCDEVRHHLKTPLNRAALDRVKSGSSNFGSTKGHFGEGKISLHNRIGLFIRNNFLKYCTEIKFWYQ